MSVQRLMQKLLVLGFLPMKLVLRYTFFITLLYGLSDLVSSKIITHTGEKLIQIPGLPPMFDHEFFPQKVCPF